MAGSEGLIEIRQLQRLDEFGDVIRLQQRIWGFADVELLPLRFLVVVSKVGGHVFGAFDGPEMIAFCFAIPGVKPGGQPYLHSHMLGVLPEYHNRGIGRRLKLRQREEALGRGIQLIEWTFDPLELKNAFFNIERLGVIVRRYSENQYGVTASPLHGGLPTDRCIAEWWLDSPRVSAVLGAAIPFRAPNSRAHRLPGGDRPHSRQPPGLRAPHSASQRGEVSGGVRTRPGGHRFRTYRRAGNLPSGAMAMKIERITLRQIRMPLVHFFETSFGRTYSRDIILVEVQGEGASGWGEVTAGENPFYNEEWTESAWLILRDYAAPRVLGKRDLGPRRCLSADRPHPRPQHGARRPGSGRVGPGGPARRRPAVEEDRGRRAPRDSRAAFRSAFRIRWSSCSRRSRRNWRPDTSGSR